MLIQLKSLFISTHYRMEKCVEYCVPLSFSNLPDNTASISVVTSYTTHFKFPAAAKCCVLSPLAPNKGFLSERSVDVCLHLASFPLLC